MVGGCGEKPGSGVGTHPEGLPRSDSPAPVTVYCSLDDSHARPIAAAFRQKTGVEVLLVSDTEETKSTGLLNRLLAEKDRPRADVFLSGDVARAALLKKRMISMPWVSANPPPVRDEWFGQGSGEGEHHHVNLAARVRVLIYHKKRVGTEVPRSIMDLVNPRYRGKACIANPLFGTTAMHAAALFQQLGASSAEQFFQALITNQVKMLSSNGEVRRRVSSGEYVFGLTDSDDVSVALRDGADVGWVIPDQDGMGALLIPCSAVLIRDGPNPEGAKRFMEFLRTDEVGRLLVEGEGAFWPWSEHLPMPQVFGGGSPRRFRVFSPDPDALADWMGRLSEGFLHQWVSVQSRSPFSSP